MSDKCDLCLLGLIILSSLLTGTSGVDDDHVFISSGVNVSLSCNKTLSDCKSTKWIYYNSHSAVVALIELGIKKNNTERHERLSLESDCSLNIKNVTEEDYGSYICQQYVNDRRQGSDARVYLHVLHASSLQTEISPGRSVTLSCQLYSYTGFSCDDWVSYEGFELLWVNQAGVDLKKDTRYQILSSDHCIITLTTTLLNEDNNREWRCQLTRRNQLHTSVTYTVKYSAQADSTTAVNPVHITNSQDPSSINTHVSKGLLLLRKLKLIRQHQTQTLIIQFQTHKGHNHSLLSLSIIVPNLPCPSLTLSSISSSVIVISVAAVAVFLLALLWLICRKTADNKRGTGDSAVKDENEHKGTYETINTSIPPDPRADEQTDDLTYSEVTYSSTKPVKSLNDHNDTVTYTAVRGRENKPQDELYASVNKNKTFTNKH
ncbi:uncharacterized protein LOC143714377 [Siphateles boraxobius]|uniref:uncharacterized protein LOC143714377 n=1 Tax=Siphateles boraxobius TaxID=180520 RepID=UPI0040634042